MLQHLGFWKHLEKLALIFLSNFHRELSFFKIRKTKLSPEFYVKNIKNHDYFILDGTLQNKTAYCKPKNDRLAEKLKQIYNQNNPQC